MYSVFRSRFSERFFVLIYCELFAAAPAADLLSLVNELPQAHRTATPFDRLVFPTLRSAETGCRCEPAALSHSGSPEAGTLTGTPPPLFHAMNNRRNSGGMTPTTDRTRIADPDRFSNAVHARRTGYSAWRERETPTAE